MAMHGYRVPMGYSKSGKSYDEFARIMGRNAENEMTKWLKKFVGKINSRLILRDKETFADQVIDLAKKENFDLIVIGSKGMSKTTLTLLGSQTLKLLKANEHIPLMIVKKEGENIQFLEALGRI
jgi:nucleotide-binding universal stress UspA family protein